jgi:putative Holliday junction resolvase
MIGRLMGVDHGLKRIGLAVSDAAGLTARELAIIERKSKREDFARIEHFAADQKVVAFIVGLPTNLDAAPDTPTHTHKVLNWVEYFRTTTALPIVLWDEQMSSHDALALARQKRRPYSAPLDDLAARIILQSYLDAIRDGMIPLPDFVQEQE